MSASASHWAQRKVRGIKLSIEPFPMILNDEKPEFKNNYWKEWLERKGKVINKRIKGRELNILVMGK